MSLPSLAALAVSVEQKRQRATYDSDDTSDAEAQDQSQGELETVVVDYIKPRTLSVGIGGALPVLPISNVVRKRMVCDGSSKELVVPTATLNTSNVYGSKTLVYHSFINPCQPKYKGEVGDLGRIKWYAFDPRMSYNYLLEATGGTTTPEVAKMKAAEAGCPLPAPNMMMDVYELVAPVENLMLFNDLSDGAWKAMGGHEPVILTKPLCISEISKEMMESDSDVDPTIDPSAPPQELAFAKRMHTFPFRDGTTSLGWIRLNSATRAEPSWYDPKDRGKSVLLVEIGYELMLSAENHAKFLKHVKRVKIQPSFQQESLYKVYTHPV